MAGRKTILRNARVFDGRTGALTGARDVIVRGQLIESILPTGEAPRGSDREIG